MPHLHQTLFNITETAPETWGEGFYDEKSDIFSFAIVLWRLFGTKSSNSDKGSNIRSFKFSISDIS
jgi:hypothetical protein